MACMGKRRLDFVIPPEYDGRKAIHFLRGPAQCSYTLVRSLKTFEDGILLTGTRIRTIDRLHTGDCLSITICDAPQTFEPCEIPVEILYEDSDVIVYNKPAAMLAILCAVCARGRWLMCLRATAPQTERAVPAGLWDGSTAIQAERL